MEERSEHKDTKDSISYEVDAKVILKTSCHAMYLKSKDWKNYIRVRRLSLLKMCVWHNLMLAHIVRKARASTFFFLSEKELYRKQM